MRYISLFIFFFLVYPIFAQQALFQQNNRICFVGNSITHGGDFHHNILLFQMTRFPFVRVDFFNNGISGDITGGILKRMESDIFVHRPTHCIIMIGMNDVRRNLYGSQPTQNVDTLTLRKNALNLYKKNLEEIVKIFLSKNIKVILQKPSIYDQTAILKTANNFGVNDALKECADFGQTLADKNQLKTVDYWSIMTELNKNLQKADPSVSIVGNDRVHPGAVGHLVMSYQFLKSLEFPKLVSSIEIKKDKTKCQNCEIADFKRDTKKIIFSVLEKSLPFPIVENQKKATELVNFMNDLNQEVLQVAKLSKGNYQLKIDNIEIGTFSENELKKGINLAQFENTPQYRQALAVRKTLTKLWDDEANLRTIKWTEFSHMNEFAVKNDLEAARKYLEKRFDEKYKLMSNASYYKSQFDKYFVVKPQEQLYINESEALKNKAFQEAVPVKHLFQLQKIQ
jgi:lysophospholipase L1-like esterase